MWMVVKIGGAEHDFNSGKARKILLNLKNDNHFSYRMQGAFKL
jgi:hypothetical protein